MPSVPVLIRPILLRDPNEEGRTSTTLELFFDLVFVVTVSAVAQQWHHAISVGHVRDGLISFVEMMFGTWWAWMGFTWFANFFDPDDVPYRLLVLVQLLASLGLATGVPYVFKDDDFRVVVCCYVVIRIVMATQWLRAARGNPTLRRYCYRWAVGISVVQLGWIGYGFGFRHLTHLQTIPFFIVGAAIEMSIPIWAHSLPAAETASAHPDHAEERYGLFTIIILGEMILVASDAFNTALQGRDHLLPLITGAVSGAILAFCLWWLYFGFLGEYDLSNLRTSFIWGYGHYFIFAALAAVGGTLAALLSQIAKHDSHLSRVGMALTVAVPVALFLATAGLLRQVSQWAFCRRWLTAAAGVLVLGTLIGSRGPVWALLSVCVVTAAFLASEIITKVRKAAVLAGAGADAGVE